MSLINIMPCQPLSDEFYEMIQTDWMIQKDLVGDYIQSDVIALTQEEGDACYDAANELYDMFVQAGQAVIDNKLFDKMGIQPELREMIEYTWEHDNHYHLYGRFDFGGGIAGKPIKLIEFNADTATSIPECAIIQWAHLMSNKLDENMQFNDVFKQFVYNFKQLRKLNPKKHPAILITAMDSMEDRSNVEFIGQAAIEAGFEVTYADLPDVTFSEDEGEDGGVWHKTLGEYTKYDFWFKLIPWEHMVVDFPELVKILTGIVKREQCVILNPAYTMLFQNKNILKMLWEMFPNHPLLLETSDKPLKGKSYVEKVVLGREGANVTIFDSNNKVIAGKEGEYGDQVKIYQEFYEYPKDDIGRIYQAGVFFSSQASGLCFRRTEGGNEKIIHNTAQFISHKVLNSNL